MVPDRPQHIIPTASVVAKGYSSAIRLTALTVPHGKIRHALKKILLHVFTFYKVAQVVEFLGGLNNSGSVVHSTTISAVIT
jgi:hypothetical protein